MYIAITRIGSDSIVLLETTDDFEPIRTGINVPRPPIARGAVDCGGRFTSGREEWANERRRSLSDQ
jgi:hypothetical protein